MQSIAITHRSLHRLPGRSEDETNLTMAWRSFGDYDWKLGLYLADSNRLDSFVKSRISGKNFCYLDSGAGHGTAIDTFLEKYGGSTKKCVGISLHYFSDVKQLLKEHRAKLKWYLGPAQAALGRMHEKFDLITDFFGAYFYSVERPELLRLYHSRLKAGGRAYIYLNPITCDKHAAARIKRKRVYRHLEAELADKYPETFQLSREGAVLIITKCSKRCPPIEYEVQRKVYHRSITCETRRPTRAFYKQGNALFPKVTLIEGPPRKRLRQIFLDSENDID